MPAPETTVDLQAMAHSILGIAPLPANEAERDELADLRAKHTELMRLVSALDLSVSALRKEAYRLEMRAMTLEGRSHLLRYSWLEAFVEGRMEDCDNIVASDEYKREQRAGASL